MFKRVGKGRETPTRPWKKQRQALRRQVAEERNAKYQALSLQEKLDRNSTKVQSKLLKRVV